MSRPDTFIDRIGAALGFRNRRTPDERLDFLVRWTGWATLLILAGYLIDLTVLWSLPQEHDERLWLTLADAVIAAGLFAEFIIAERTIAVSREGRREHMRDMLTPEVKAALFGALLPHRDFGVTITSLVGDPASRSFAEQFRAPFTEAGWDVRLSMVISTDDIPFGLHIPSQVQGSDLDPGAVRALRQAFDAAGIGFVPSDMPPWSMESTAAAPRVATRAVLYVGPKPPPA